MKSNIPVNRSVINYIHARNYFPQHEVEQWRPSVQDVNWIDKKFGQEMENFNLIFNDIDLVFSKMIGDPQEGKPQLDYFNPEHWEMEALIRMKPNDVLFYRPWIFHSFTSGILHYYKLKVI